MSFETQDTKIYSHITSKLHFYPEQMRSMHGSTAFLLHILFKCIVMVMFQFQQIFDFLTSVFITYEITVILVIIDFWITKNITGRNLIGLRWFFADDENGIQHFMFERRINDGYLSAVSSKLFWVVQGCYIIVPSIDMVTTMVIAPNLYRISFSKIFVNICVISSGISNFFLFYKAHNAAMTKKYKFQKLYGCEFLRKLGTNSIIGKF